MKFAYVLRRRILLSAAAVVMLAGAAAAVRFEKINTFFMNAQAAEAYDISSAEITYAKSHTFGGVAKTPAVTVKMGGVTLKKNTDYTVSYSNNINVGTAYLTVSGKGKYSGSVKKSFTISPRSVSNCSVSLATETKYFNGVRAKPVLIVKIGDKTVTSADYSTCYTDNLSVGTGKVTVTGRKNLKGTVTRYFKILPRNINNCGITIDEENFDCESENLKQFITVTVVGKEIYSGNYEVTAVNDYSKGISTLTIAGQRNLAGTVTKTVKLPEDDRVDISSAGFTVTLGAESFIYSGSAVTPSVKVQNGGVNLKSGTDFRVVYLDNVNAGTARAVVEGIGNYKGSVTKSFSISQKYISAAEITVDDSSLVFDGKPKEPKITARFGGKLLEEGRDYTLEYLNNINTSNSPAVRIAGIGNFQGAVSKKFAIASRKAEDCVVTLSSESFEYTGGYIKPGVSVTLDGNTLRAGTDYSVAYSDNLSAGTAKVTVTGKMLLTGTLVKTYQITPADISKRCETAFDNKAVYYTGSAAVPAVTVTKGETVLKNGRDYVLAGENNINAGTASVTVKGIGNYCGSVTGNFEILPRTIGSAEFFADDSGLVFDGTAKEPAVTMTYNGMELKEGKDYTLEYRYNVNTSNSPTVIVTGLGNYIGSINRKFTVSPRPAADCVVTLSSDSFEYTGGYIKPEVSVTLDGNTLRAGTDYSVAYSDNLSAGTARVTVTGKMLLTGAVEKTYRITPVDISKKGEASLNNTDFYYTGKPVEPAVTVSSQGKLLVQDKDFTVSYADNLNSGEGRITVAATGNYTGTVQLGFEIQPRYLGKAEISVDDAGVVYDGTPKQPKVTVSYEGSQLECGKDYIIECANNINATSNPSVTVKGTGNFSGELSSHFTIQPKPVSDCLLPAYSYTYKYTGGYITPFKNTFFGGELEAGRDYDISYENNTGIGEGVAVIEGKSNYTGTLRQPFQIKYDISRMNISGIDPKYTADGNEIVPEIRVRNGNTLLSENIHYTVALSNNRSAGTANVQIMGMGEYTGSIEKTFEITDQNTPEYTTVEFDDTDSVLKNPHKGLLYYTGARNGFKIGEAFLDRYGEYSDTAYARIYWYQVEKTAPEYKIDTNGNILKDEYGYPVIAKRNYDWATIDEAIRSAAERDCTYALAIFPGVNPSIAYDTTNEALNENGYYYVTPYWLAQSLGLENSFYSEETKNDAGYLKEVSDFGAMPGDSGLTVQWIPNWKNEYIRELTNGMVRDFAKHLSETPCGDGVMADYVEYVVISSYGACGIPLVDAIGPQEEFGLGSDELYSDYIEPFIEAFKGEGCSQSLKDITLLGAYANPHREDGAGLYDSLYEKLLKSKTVSIASYGVLAYLEAKGEVENSICSSADGYMPTVYEYIQKYEYLRDIMLSPDRVGEGTTDCQRDGIIMERMKTAVENGRPTYIELDAEMIDPEKSSSPEEFSQLYRYLANRIGYYFRITEAKYSVTGDILDMKLTFKNDGVTQLYGSARVYVGVFDKNGNLISKYDTGIDASQWRSDSQYDHNISLKLEGYTKDSRLAIGLFENENDAYPAYALGSASSFGSVNNWYMLG